MRGARRPGRRAGFAHRPIGSLSGGEQQRLLIAQALARRPALLLLDEPLDSLDLANQVAIAGLLAEICRDEGVTVLIVAHDVNPILTYLDQVVYVANGGAVSGPPREVVTSETLTALYGTPVDVLRSVRRPARRGRTTRRPHPSLTPAVCG